MLSLQIILSVLLLLAPVFSLDLVFPDKDDVSIQQGELSPVEFETSSQPYRVELVFNSSIYVEIINNTIIGADGRGTLWIRGKVLTSRYILEAIDCISFEENATCPLDLSKAYVRVTVLKSKTLDWIVDLVGWAYFFAWSISFYPQIFLNLRRKSVIGLNFDFLLLNVVGFSAYTLYNCLIYFNDHVQEEYEGKHPRSPIPVLLNDVVFAVHALIACLITVGQCFVYEKENQQRISKPCIGLASLLVLAGGVSAILSIADVYNALTFVNSLSYIKMLVTLSKYFPQAFYNIRRKSTVGWSIGNVLLDFTGGSLDILQMILQALNVNDWSSFYGNPVKFGLGLVSIIFDVVFILQHYVLYRNAETAHNEYSGIDNPDVQSGVTDYGSQDVPSTTGIIAPERV